MIQLEDRLDERIVEFTNLKDKTLLKDNKIIAESEKVVIKALSSNHTVYKVLCTEDFYHRNKELIDSKSNECFVANKDLLQDIVGHKLHHGILALVQKPASESLNNLSDRIIIFNGVMSPENVGTITRAALAFGFDSIIYDYKSASPYLRRCNRVSMGNVFEVKTHLSQNLPHTFNELRELGYTVGATANEVGAVSLKGYKYPEKFCLVIGNEGHGMDREVIDACDIKLKIEISNYVAHLNAASAASIFLYHSSL